MRIIYQDTNQFFLRFDSNEEVIEGLKKFASENNLFGSFSAIGAAKEVVLSYYNLATKQYEDKEIHEDVEIISILGNIASMEGKTIVHCHGNFANNKFETIAGHVKNVIVSATCEVHIHIFQDKIERSFDDQTGLNVLK